jgi:nitrogen fixation NifU-like protein
MNELDALYRELILDHSKHPQHFGLTPRARPGRRRRPRTRRTPSAATRSRCARASTARRSPTCVGGAGCSISQASASMLADLVAEEGSAAPKRSR